MKRRKFLLVSIFALFLSLISLWYFKFKSAKTKALSYPTDLSEICDHETLIQIGNTYMTLINENDKRNLKELLVQDAGMMGNDLEITLKSKVAEDFNSGNTILVDGWLLSITEARQCAFLYMSEAN
ncbi:MAG: hypothetical protein KJO53_12470 [Eudoraea sp.]|nr:hypothetical protein [Eudoraea sp.]MBT8294572.1 hypothetical protein [Eudoraea sp.]NNL01755.1 hypothetical protein [Eudoraea sp.]